MPLRNSRGCSMWIMVPWATPSRQRATGLPDAIGHSAGSLLARQAPASAIIFELCAQRSGRLAQPSFRRQWGGSTWRPWWQSRRESWWVGSCHPRPFRRSSRSSPRRRPTWPRCGSSIPNISTSHGRPSESPHDCHGDDADPHPRRRDDCLVLLGQFDAIEQIWKQWGHRGIEDITQR